MQADLKAGKALLVRVTAGMLSEPKLSKLQQAQLLYARSAEAGNEAGGKARSAMYQFGKAFRGTKAEATTPEQKAAVEVGESAGAALTRSPRCTTNAFVAPPRRFCHSILPWHVVTVLPPPLPLPLPRSTTTS